MAKLPQGAEIDARVRRAARYGLSLPERALRSAAGILGGTLRESAAVLLPQTFRDAKTYRVFVGQMLDFLAEDMGGVERSATGAGSREAPIDDYVARKTVGNFIDLASLATLHLSPMLLLAVVSDVAYGSQAYLRELAVELERRGVIESAERIDRVDDLLDAVASATEETATAFDAPPLSADGLRDTVEQTREAFAKVDPSKVISEAEVRHLWETMQATARRQGVDPLSLSGAMTLQSLRRIGTLGRGALSTVQAAGTLLDRHVLDHYRQVLVDIDDKGFYPTLAATSRPYADAVWRNFARQNTTATEAFLDRGGLKQAWTRAVRQTKNRLPRRDRTDL